MSTQVDASRQVASTHFDRTERFGVGGQSPARSGVVARRGRNADWRNSLSVVAVATHPASAVADDELARHLDAGLRDLVHLTDLADRVTADDLWDKVNTIEPACARRIVHTAALLARWARDRERWVA